MEPGQQRRGWAVVLVAALAVFALVVARPVVGGALGLDGATVGRGGGGAIQVGPRERYVVGKVSLDSALTDESTQRLILQHELAHVLGLGHAEGRGQLMHGEYVGQDGFGRGDLAGLRALHDVACDGAP